MTTTINFAPHKLRLRGLIHVSIDPGTSFVTVTYPVPVSPAPVPFASPIGKVNAVDPDPPFVTGETHDENGFTLLLSGKTTATCNLHILLV